MILHETIAGVVLEITATETHAVGEMTNAVNAEDEHYVHGVASTTYTGVQVAKPASRGCRVYEDNGGSKGAEGTVTSNPMTGTSEAQGMRGRLFPASGGVFASFFIQCAKPVAALEGLWEVSGEVSCPADGATVNCDGLETREEGTLQAKGHAIGIEVSTTYKGRANSGEPYTALSSTTVET